MPRFALWTSRASFSRSFTTSDSVPPPIYPSGAITSDSASSSRIPSYNKRGGHGISAAEIDADKLPPHKMIDAYPGYSPPSYIHEIPLGTNARPADHAKHTYKHMATNPLTAASLFRKLLQILSRNQRPRLQNLVVYYLSHISRNPSLASTRSFNLLISLALRNLRIGTAARLLNIMRTRQIREDLETHKLSVRLLLRREGWDKAWQEVQHHLKFYQFPGDWTSQSEKPMPLAIWMELLETSTKPGHRRRLQNGNNGSDRPYITRSEQYSKSISRSGEQTSSDTERLTKLMSAVPFVNQSEASKMPATAVYKLVLMLLHTNQTGIALQISKSYISALSSPLTTRCARGCLDIIHLHIIHGSTKHGLSRHFDILRRFHSLLALNEELRPNSTSALLLLRSLQSSKRCGTYALKFLNTFKRRWGVELEDRRVRRRIISLALKEGRNDIVENMLRKEGICRWSRKVLNIQSEVLGEINPKRTLRPPLRRVYPNHGAEGQRWRHLAQTIKRRRSQYNKGHFS